MKSIIRNAHQVKAILAGVSQLRLPMNPQPRSKPDSLGDLYAWRPNAGNLGCVITWPAFCLANRQDMICAFAPCSVGDVVAVHGLCIYITGIRCEKCADISEADALACGFSEKLSALLDWDKQYGPRYPWATSWCWVVEFRRAEASR